MKRKGLDLEINRKETPLPDFIEKYNASIPASFPRASLASLQEFRVSHPILFKKGAGWSVDRHRKRLMDWLSSYRHES